MQDKGMVAIVVGICFNLNRNSTTSFFIFYSYSKKQYINELKDLNKEKKTYKLIKLFNHDMIPNPYEK